MRLFELKMHHSLPVKNLFEVISSVLSEANIEILPGEIKNAKEENAEDDIDIIPESDDEEKSNRESDDEDGEDGEDGENDEDGEDEEEDNKGSGTENDIKKKKPGLKITALDQTKTVLVHVRLHDFTYFKCTKGFSFGIGMKQLYKHIKTLDKEDIFKMYMDQSNDNKLWLEFENPTPASKKISTMSMTIRDTDNNEEYVLPPISFEARVIMLSADFNRVIKEMSSVGTHIEIEVKEKQIKFACKSPVSTRETIFKKNNTNSTELGIQWVDGSNDSPKYYKSKFELKFLSLFARSQSISPHVEIYLKSGMPILLNYEVGKIGKIIFCMSPYDEKKTASKFKDVKDEYKEIKVDMIEDEDEDEDED